MEEKAFRRALVITPYFFGYERLITEEFRRQGWSVTLIDERPNNTALMRAVFRARPSLAATQIRRYYRRLDAQLGREDFDLILVIKGEVLPEWFLRVLRERNARARVVGYTYDSVKNSPRFLELKELFDTTFSFDRADSDAYGLRYLPLFFAPVFDTFAAGPRQPSRVYDACFVGTLHSRRYPLVMAATRGMLAYRFFYVQARWYFAFMKYVTGEARDIKWSEVEFSSLSLVQVAEIFARSRCVIDIQRDGQRGLTMRTFEALASGAVLATSNAAVTQESLYDPSRIVVFDENCPEGARRLIALAVENYTVDSSWVSRKLEPYSLANWVAALAGADPTDRVIRESPN